MLAVTDLKYDNSFFFKFGFCFLFHLISSFRVNFVLD